MKYWILIVSLVLNIGLIYTLESRKFVPLAFGSLLSPQEGFWQNAESVNADFSGDIDLEELNAQVDVYFDDRLVPHVFAEHEKDAYYVQGYLHAKFRLWQMEFQTHAAAGRISEIVGEKALKFDRNQRRIGMVYAAENALHAMEQDPQTLDALNAYTQGVNAYIKKLKKSELPIEYKILGYQPELWTNLKSALFTKQMTNTLAGYDTDFEFTNAWNVLGEQDFRVLYADLPDSLYPVIPKGTAYESPMFDLSIPASADSLYFKRNDSIYFAEDFKPDPSNGSNNWVVSGSKTNSGKPILANDPHLNLTLPSIWYEIQIHTSQYNSYGVSFPGLPGVVIGYNDSIAFGFTNAGRDVKDYYEIKFKDNQKSEYLFDGGWKPTTTRIEEIRIKDKPNFKDTVAYTVFGPVTYDQSFGTNLSNQKAYSLRWVAHDTSNILKMWLLLNRAQNHNDYLQAIQFFNVPGQNMIFASRSGDIALWQQATFPLRWKDQGLFVMPGTDSSYMWKGFIPSEHNPHAYNPAQGYISSANQRPADSTYPYFIPGSYEVYRAITINRVLGQSNDISVNDMKKLQNNNYNVFAEIARPLLLKYINKNQLNSDEREWVKTVEDWNLNNDPDQYGPTCFQAWWDSLYTTVFNDELMQTEIPLPRPEKFVLLENLMRDSLFKFIDNRNTPEIEDIYTQVTAALKKASPKLIDLKKENKLAWASFKNTTVYHLLRDNAMPFARSGLMNGGGHGIVNAVQHDHGPSWRMIVHMTDPIEAYGVYPGGQNGNPGSRFYDDFIDTWTRGEYYTLMSMQEDDIERKNYKWKLSFH